MLFPQLSVTIKQDLKMTQEDVANSNIVALLATLLVRLIAGPLCDRFGPRLVFVGLLLCGAIPTAMAGLVTTPKGLIALRFLTNRLLEQPIHWPVVGAMLVEELPSES